MILTSWHWTGRIIQSIGQKLLNIIISEGAVVVVIAVVVIILLIMFGLTVVRRELEGAQN